MHEDEQFEYDEDEIISEEPEFDDTFVEEEEEFDEFKADFDDD